MKVSGRDCYNLDCAAFSKAETGEVAIRLRAIFNYSGADSPTRRVLALGEIAA